MSLRKELFDEDGNLYFYCEYNDEEDWIYNCWIGSISDDRVKLGGEMILEEIEKRNTKQILNDNRKLSGNWSESNDWLENEYLPRAAKLGMKYIAHVFSPNFITKFSAVDLSTRDLPIIFEAFGDIAEAENWLRSQKENL